MLRFASLVAVLALGIADAHATPPAQGVGVWDGAPSIGGAWIAHPDHDGRASPLVTIRTEAGDETQARLVRRGGVGRGYLLAAETARALDLEPGEPALLTIVELLEPREDVEATDVEAGDASLASAAAPEGVAERGLLEETELSPQVEDAVRDGEVALAPRIVSTYPPPRPEDADTRDVAVGLMPPDAAPLPRVRPAVRAAAPESALATSSGEDERSEPATGDPIRRETGDASGAAGSAAPRDPDDRVEASPSDDGGDRGERNETASSAAAPVDAGSQIQASAGDDGDDVSFSASPGRSTGDGVYGADRAQPNRTELVVASGAPPATLGRAASGPEAFGADQRDDADSAAAPEHVGSPADNAAPSDVSLSASVAGRIARERVEVPPSAPKTSLAATTSPDLSQRPARRPLGAVIARPEASPPPMPRPVLEGAPA